MQMLNKVPEVTLGFWLIKTMATTVGETAADYLNTTFHLGLTLTSYIMGAILIIAITIQLLARSYKPIVYWLTVVLVSIVGTLISDDLVDNFGVTLPVSTAIFAAGLAAMFSAWYFVERTLSVHTITTTRRELFYWAAILFTFALGTSAGDLVAEQLRVGYALSLLLFAGLIGLVAVAYYGLKVNSVLAFWVAYILTRPLGASVGDWLSQPTRLGGLGLGVTWTSLAFLTVITLLALRMSQQQRQASKAA